MLFFQLVANGIVAGCAYALVALGFGLVYNTTRILHLAHGAVFVLAAYLFYTAVSLWQLPLFLAVGFTVAMAVVFGMLIDEVIYRPLDRPKASLLIPLLSSLGVYIVIVNVIALVWGNQTKVVNPGLQQTVGFGEVILTEVQVVTVLVFLVLFLGMAVGLRRSAWGWRLRAMRDDAELVAAVGISPVGIRRFVFGAGSALAAVAAILLSLDVGINPHIGLTAVLTAAVALIIGGVGIFEGAALGALLLGLLQSLAVWQFSPRWQQAVLFFVLMLFLLLRPEGILGQRRRIEEAAA